VKVAIVTNNILHYRVPLYSRLSNRLDVTIIHSGKPVGRESGIKEIVLRCNKVGPFSLQTGLLKLGLEQYDAIIYMCDIRWIYSILAFIKYRKRNISIWWGSWRTNKPVVDRLKLFLLSLSDANIFYSIKHRDEFELIGLKLGVSFVANNTVQIDNPIDTSILSKKCSFIHVGSLNYRKRLDVVIRAIARLREEGLGYNFDIVGSGEEEANLKGLVKELALSNFVKFHGRISDEKELTLIYSKSIAAISPGQAGLAVLQSMAFGVPFVTSRNAISGGEKENIVNGKNGILLENVSVESFCTFVRRVHSGEHDLLLMGAEAFVTYRTSASMELMVDAFCDAITFSKMKRNG